MAEAVVLGDLELERVTALTILEQRKLSVHPWPGNEGDLVQDLGAASAWIRLEGVAMGEEAGDRLSELRQAMQAGKPLDFTASAAVSSNIEQVMISALEVSQPPGRLAYYEYRMELVRYVPPPPPAAAGFDPGALAGINGEISLEAAADLGSFMESTGKLGDALEAAGAAMDSAESALEAAGKLQEAFTALQEIAGTVMGAVEDAALIAKLLEKTGAVVSALGK